jgi:hypothetical protein
MPKQANHFEIIDQYGQRHRFDRSQGYWWAWKPKPGTIDADDPEFLDVFREDAEGETDIVDTFPKPARVGDVFEDSCLSVPLREKPIEQCPLCGFKQLKE